MSGPSTASSGLPVSLPSDCGDRCKEGSGPAWHTAEYRWQLRSLAEGHGKKSAVLLYTSRQQSLNPAQPFLLIIRRPTFVTRHVERKGHTGEFKKNKKLVSHVFIKAFRRVLYNQGWLNVLFE